MNLFDLVAVLTLNKKGYEEGLEEASSEATSFGDKVKKGLGTATKVAGALGGVAIAAGGGIVKMASSSASAMDVIDKSSQKMGVSTTAYQEWSHAMDLSGMSIDTMKTGMKSLQTAMTGMDEEGNATSEEFQKLGISLTDASGNIRSAEDVMNEAIMALADMDEGAERTAIATKLFGKAGMEMAPLLNSGSEAIAQMKQEAHDLGLVMSEDDVKAGAALNDSLSNLKQSFGAIITRLGNGLMPVVQKLADALIKFMPKIQEMFDRFAPLLLDFADKVVPFLLDLAEALLPTIFDLLETVMPTLTMLIQSVLPIIQTALQAINPLLEILTKILKPVLDLVNLLLKPLLDLVNWVFGKISDGISAISDALGEGGIMGILGLVGDAFGTIFGGIAKLLEDPLQAIKDFFNGVWEICTKIMGWVWDKVSGVFQDIYDFLDWINPFSDSAEERAEKARVENARKTTQAIIQNGGASGYLEKANEMIANSSLLSAVVPTVKNELSGTVRFEGVNSEGEFVAAADYTADQLAKKMTQDARLYGGY